MENLTKKLFRISIIGSVLDYKMFFLIFFLAYIIFYQSNKKNVIKKSEMGQLAEI